MPIWPAESDIDAAARVLDRVGRVHGWWPEKSPAYDEMDPIGRSELGGLVEEMFLAAARIGRSPALDDFSPLEIISFWRYAGPSLWFASEPTFEKSAAAMNEPTWPPRPVSTKAGRRARRARWPICC